MLTKRKLDNFDPVFLQVTERAVAMIPRTTPDGEPLLRIPCKTRGQAVNVMMQLRQYWQALQRELEQGKLPEYDTRYRLAQNAGMLAVRDMKDNIRTIEVVHRSQLTTSKVLAEAIGGLKAALSIIEPLPAPSAVPGAVVPDSAQAKSAQDQIFDEELEKGAGTA